MKILRLKPNFKDKRGLIMDVLTVPVDAVTMITSKKGAVRGNHYHKKTTQWTFVVSGSLRFYTLKNGKPFSRVLKAGDLVESKPGELHTFKAVTDCTFLSISKGPRRGIDFEKDTYRLEVPLSR